MTTVTEVNAERRAWIERQRELELIKAIEEQVNKQNN